MQKLLSGIHRFQDSVYHARRAFFEQLAGGQSPEALFIACSDSRVDPSMITQSDPGTLFVVRNVGNIVPPYSAQTRDGAAAAAIEYAVSVLKVKDIIICGHSHCGAMQALLNPASVSEFPSLCGWLANAESTQRIVKENYSHLPDDQRLRVGVQENVLVQLENLRTHPAVAAAISRGQIGLHGWVYKIETGEVFSYHPKEEQYLPLGTPAEAIVASAS